MSTLPADFWTTLPLGADVHLLTKDENGLAAFDKPTGVLAHPNEPKDEPRALLTCHYDAAGEYFSWRDAANVEQRLYLLNRLDSATSGVILVAASKALAETIKQQFAKKQVKKVYNTLVFGKPAVRMQVWRDMLAVKRKGGIVRATTVGNVPSVTQMQFVKSNMGTFTTSLLRLEPQTGRSHQLRVQCATRHLPIVGDQNYGNFNLNRAFAKATQNKRLFLHSLDTSFSYDFAGRTFHFKAHAPLPRDFSTAY